MCPAAGQLISGASATGARTRDGEHDLEALMRALAGQGTWNLDELVMQELCLNDERLRPYPGFKGLPCAAGHAATGPA